MILTNKPRAGNPSGVIEDFRISPSQVTEAPWASILVEDRASWVSVSKIKGIVTATRRLIFPACLCLGIGLILHFIVHRELGDVYQGVFEGIVLIGSFSIVLAFWLSLYVRPLSLASDGAGADGSPDQHLQWNVKVNLVRNGWVTGRDRGVLWIDSEKLYFAGSATSFALSRGLLVGKSPLKVRSYRFLPMQRRISLRLAPEFSGAETSIELDVSGGLGAFSPFIQFLKKAEQRGTHLETLVLSLGWFCERSHRDRSGQVPPRAPGPGAQTSRELTIALALASGLAIVRAGAIAGIAYGVLYPRRPFAFAVTSEKHLGVQDILRILYSCNPDAFLITFTQALFFSACLYAPEVILCIRAMAAKRRAHRFVSGSGLSDSTPAGRHCGEES